MARWQKHEATHCLWCNAELPRESATRYPNFCSGRCAWKDGDDAQETERDKWAYYTEV